MIWSWWIALVLFAAPGLWAAVAIVVDMGNPGQMLGGDAGETLIHHFGEWGLRMLLVSLALSSLRRRAGFSQAIRLRRLAGLTAFTYLSLHGLSYLWFLAGFQWAQIQEDLVERTYITVGFAAWLILFALAVTSTRGWQRRLRKHWQTLHALIYVAIPLGVLHLLWLTKAGYAEALAYAFVYAILMFERQLARRSRQTVS